jgi:transcriptional regulator with XRE-family HTH domain
MKQSKEIGQRIKQIRTEIAKTSQFEFSEQVCMTQSNLSMLENGKTYPSCFFVTKNNATLQAERKLAFDRRRYYADRRQIARC